MNSAELRDSWKAVMPLSETRKEVNAISEYIIRYSFEKTMSMVSKKFDANKVNHIYIIGSGDSYALSLLYAALFNNMMGKATRAIQSYEFIQENLDYIDDRWLIIVLNPSGKASPIVDALEKAQKTSAQVLAITNKSESYFASKANCTIVTGTTRMGMPTLSDIAIALHLDAIGSILSAKYKNRLEYELPCLLNIIQCLPGLSSLSWCRELTNNLFNKRITLLGSGGDYGLAVLFSNQLCCGPQLSNRALQAEEFAHSLRINQVSSDDLVIIFDSTGNNSPLIKHLIKQLNSKNAVTMHIDHELLSLTMKGSTGLFSKQDNCRYYVLVLIFNLIISATEKYISDGGHRVSVQ